MVQSEYAYASLPGCRYGEGQPLHVAIEAALASGRDAYAETLRDIAALVPDLQRIPVHADPEQPLGPHWQNRFLPALDVATLYGMIASRKPRVYCEIGSGNSTRVAALARRQHSPATRIVSIDPAPRADVAGLCDRVERVPLQSCDLALFEVLEPGDIVFLDGSHQVLPSSDVSVFFLEVLPRLQPGVIVEIHDICWPADYPSAWHGRQYSEQYMLAMLLLYARERLRIIAANAWITMQPELTGILAPLWTGHGGIYPAGSSFWFTIGESNGSQSPAKAPTRRRSPR